MRSRRRVQAPGRRVEFVEGKLVDRLGDLGAHAAHCPCLVDDQQAVRLPDARNDRIDVEWHDGPQINDLALDALAGEDVGGLKRLVHLLTGGDDRDVTTRPGDPGHAKRHIVLAYRHLALAGEQRLGLEHDHRVAGAQGGLHQPLGVGRRGRHADDEPGHMGEDGMIHAAMVRPRTAECTGADAHHHGGIHLAVAHVAELGRLQEDLPRRFEGEIGEHQVRHGAGAGRRGADRGGREALLGNRRVDHAVGAEFGPQALGVGEAAAAFAGAFAEIEDGGVGAHFFGDAVAHRLEPALLEGGAGRLRPQGLGWIEGIGVDMLPHRRGVGLGRVAGKLQRLLHQFFDVGLDVAEILGGRDAEVLNQAFAVHVDGVALDPGVDFLLRTVGADDRVALVVADGAVGSALEEGRAAAAARAFAGLPHGEPDREHIVAVHRDARHAVGGGFRGNVGIERHRPEGGGRRIEVVFANEHHRGVLHRGEIQRLVEIAMVAAAIAKKGDADVVAALLARRHTGAGGVADAGGDDAVGAEQANRAIIEMHRAAAAAADAVDLAEQLGHDALGIATLGERVAMATVGGGDPVGSPQMGADADPGCLLADIEVQKPRRFALPAGDLRDAFEAPQQHHLFEQANEHLPVGHVAGVVHGFAGARCRDCHRVSSEFALPHVTGRIRARCDLETEA